MVIADYLRDCGYKVVEGVSADEVLAEAGRKIDVIMAEVRLAGSLVTVSDLPGRFAKIIQKPT